MTIEATREDWLFVLECLDVWSGGEFARPESVDARSVVEAALAE